MSVSTLKTINFERYFSLLEGLIPFASEFSVCDTEGTIIAESHHASHADQGLSIDPESFVQHADDNSEDKQSFCHEGELVTRFWTNIRNNTNEVVASLVASSNNDQLEQHRDEIPGFMQTLHTITSFLNKEYALTEELNSMAKELAGRYEELNLVYKSDDDSNLSNEIDSINLLLTNCVEYLGVSVAALVIPEKEIMSCVSSTSDPVTQPHNLIRQLSATLYPWVTEKNVSVILNDLSDPLRSQMNLTAPYKIMASPMINSQGNVGGMLVCLNQMYQTDFYNSDKNMLGVISRKVTKIMSVNYDSLTGLLKLKALIPAIEECCASSSAKGVFHSFLIIDLDQLKIINDSHGRGAGDAAIKTVSGSLQEHLRTTDVICYMGEGRFGVLLEKCSNEQGMRIANNLRNAIVAMDFEWNNVNINLCISIGLSLIEPQTKDSDSILEAAEIALESAKENGVNQIQTYLQDDKDLDKRRNHMQWVTRIHSALHDNRFLLYCQTIEPITSSQENYHFEILLRLLDEAGDVVLPSDFLAAAERFNLMPLLDRWVIDKAFSSLYEGGLAQQPHEGVVTINLSGQSLSDKGIVDYIDLKIAEYQLLSNCICFEITETAAINNMESAKTIINLLKDRGFYFSLDDFGTGFSSFSYLQELPVDYLKIDGSFVRQITKDNVSHAMVSSINQIGHITGIKTIAEYVENDEIKDQLQLIGVDYAQGYSVCKPVPMMEYLATLGRSTSAIAG